MSATSEDPSGLMTDSAAESACRVAVFYDHTAARERAVVLGHHLVKEFWEQLDFSFSWWRLRYLEESSLAETASLSALASDILVFSVDAASHPDPEVLRWLDMWVPQRNESLGAIVPLLYPCTADSISASPWMVEIEEMARQTGMECLLPPELKGSPLFDDTFRRVQGRSQHLGGVMDGILHRRGGGVNPPVHWGLNE